MAKKMQTKEDFKFEISYAPIKMGKGYSNPALYQAIVKHLERAEKGGHFTINKSTLNELSPNAVSGAVRTILKREKSDIIFSTSLNKSGKDKEIVSMTFLRRN